MENYKEDIIQTRTGNVGSSDSKMLQQIAELGQVPKSAMKRLAIVNGLCENPDISTSAMRLGDYVEQMTFESLHSQDVRWESNKCLVSKKYSRKNCGCLTHIDYWLQDDKKKVITIGEQKATVHNYEQARGEYIYQIYHHYLLTKEYADKIGYKVNVLFSVYDTNGVEEGHEYDPSRLTVKTLRNMEKLSKSYHLAEAMDLIDGFLEDFDEYYDGEEISYELLPANVQGQFDEITTMLAEIKEREDRVAAFKDKLYRFLQDKNIKSIRNESWSITRVDPTESKQFDSKRYLEDFAAKHPRQYKKVRSEYDKTVKRGGFVTIKLSKNN